MVGANPGGQDGQEVGELGAGHADWCSRKQPRGCAASCTRSMQKVSGLHAKSICSTCAPCAHFHAPTLLTSLMLYPMRCSLLLPCLGLLEPPMSGDCRRGEQSGVVSAQVLVLLRRGQPHAPIPALSRLLARVLARARVLRLLPGGACLGATGRRVLQHSTAQRGRTFFLCAKPKVAVTLDCGVPSSPLDSTYSGRSAEETLTRGHFLLNYLSQLRGLPEG